MHAMTDQLAATKENVQQLSSKCFSIVISRVGVERRGKSSPFSCQFSKLDVCEVLSLLLHWLGNKLWIWRLFQLRKNGKYCDYKILVFVKKSWKKKKSKRDKFLRASDGPVLCKESGLPCSQEQQRLLVPAEVSALRWRGDAAADSFQNCSRHSQTCLPQVMSLFERSGDMLMFQTPSDSVGTIPHSICLAAQKKAQE